MWPIDDRDTKPFSFSVADTAGASTTASSTATPSQPAITTPSTSLPPPSVSTPIGNSRRRATVNLDATRSCSGLPYMRNRSLHSILRNSPLPPPTAKTPISPRRQSARLAEKAARRVGYESPIERVITTNQYVKSHIDLLADEASPASSTASPVTTTPAEAQGAQGQEDMVLDLTMAYTGDETRDGGTTPGPFEEMRRRMAGLVTRTPTSPSSGPGLSSPAGVRKRKKKDTKRRWVWTIGTQEDDLDDREVGGALAAIRAAARAQAADVQAPAATSAPEGHVVAAAPPTVVVEPAVQSPMEILTPSIEMSDEADEAEGHDVIMSESEAEARTESVNAGGRPVSLTPGDVDVDMFTPTVATMRENDNRYLEPTPSRSLRQDSEGLFDAETGSRRDTPIPAELVPAE
ncbi:hypothetical protein SLS53_008231 [Cytospora paraplurivora]|uniref:Glucan 1, 4-alpha-glucosidase n=1 Tax=Cytospora paraplurivora TaxID=2898453 RepID=A0AAN9YD15_9PEZI